MTMASMAYTIGYICRNRMAVQHVKIRSREQQLRSVAAVLAPMLLHNRQIYSRLLEQRSNENPMVSSLIPAI